MQRWQSDEEVFAEMRRELFPAVIGDVMDTVGLVHQFLPPRIKPLAAAMVVLGRAMPVVEADVYLGTYLGTSDGSHNPVMAKPFGLMFRALDSLKPGEVYITTGGSPRYALWGELMSVRARQLGAAGAVLDGYSRDTSGILDLGFPTFSYGGYAQDQGVRGKVIDFRVPIEIGGTRVAPGDIIFGDGDGVCIIPQVAADEVIPLAFEKVRGENLVRKALDDGLSAEAAFDRFGIM